MLKMSLLIRGITISRKVCKFCQHFARDRSGDRKGVLCPCPPSLSPSDAASWGAVRTRARVLVRHELLLRSPHPAVHLAHPPRVLESVPLPAHGAPFNRTLRCDADEFLDGGRAFFRQETRFGQKKPGKLSSSLATQPTAFATTPFSHRLPPFSLSPLRTPAATLRPSP